MKLLAGLLLIVSSFFHQKIVSPLTLDLDTQVNYAPYSFEELGKRSYFQSEIKLEETIKEKEKYISYLFSYNADGRKISGMANIPTLEGKLPVAILLRGWVDEGIYQTGVGTKSTADFLANNGFITLAPDFLGYGSSDDASQDILLSRFNKPIEIISLLTSLETLEKAESQKVVFWAHSNGGQIALSVLEITGRKIPTSLWAPVSTPFPESILYFASEMPDGGKKLNEIIDAFKTKYHAEDFSVKSYLDKISSPIILHQGQKDEAVPPAWSEDLARELKKLNKEITFYTYKGENHNFNQGSAPHIRERDLAFFRKSLGLKTP